MLEERAEVSENPREFYTNLQRLENKPVFKYEGSGLIWDLLRSTVDSSNKTGVVLPFMKSVQWGNCKDSGYYLACTLPVRKNDGTMEPVV